MAHGKPSKKKSSKPPETRVKKLPFHAFWSGSLSFGLVNVPVLVFPASRHSGVRLRLLSPQGAPLERRYYCPSHEKELAPEEIVRGYELDDGSYIIVEDRELEAALPEKTREIALREFVDLAELPSCLLERGYYLTPQKDAARAYRLLAETMERTKRAGIATFVMREREYLVAIFAENGILCAETLRFPGELRDPATIGLPLAAPAPRRRVSDFERAIEALSSRTVPSNELADVDTRKLRAIIAKKKSAGKDLVRTTRETEELDPAREEDVDLLETIRLSLHQAGNSAAPRRRGAGSSRERTAAKRGSSSSKAPARKRAGGKAPRARPGSH